VARGTYWVEASVVHCCLVQKLMLRAIVFAMLEAELK